MYHEVDKQQYILLIYGHGKEEEVLTFTDKDEAYKALREAQASQLVPDAKYKLIWRKTFYSDWELDTK